MTEPGDERVIRVGRTDPIYQTWIWRQDSALLFKLRPVLESLRNVMDQPCVMGFEPYSCRVNGQTCSPCAIREIKVVLFGTTDEQPEEQPHD